MPTLAAQTYDVCNLTRINTRHTIVGLQARHIDLLCYWSGLRITPGRAGRVRQLVCVLHSGRARVAPPPIGAFRLRRGLGIDVADSRRTTMSLAARPLASVPNDLEAFWVPF